MRLEKKSANSKVYLVVLLALICFSACGRRRIVVKEVSPDGTMELLISHINGISCGSDGCVDITIKGRNYTKEIVRKPGWSVCFATAAWSFRSDAVAVLASNCFGPPPLAFYFNAQTQEIHPLLKHQELLEKKLEADYSIPKGTEALKWALTDEASTRFNMRRTNKIR